MNEITDILPLYPRITEWYPVSFCTNCVERHAVCPECEAAVCVFCEDACETCQTQMW